MKTKSFDKKFKKVKNLARNVGRKPGEKANNVKIERTGKNLAEFRAILNQIQNKKDEYK